MMLKQNHKQFLRKHLIEFSIFIMCCVLGIVLWHMNQLRLEIHKTTALQNASIYMDSYEGLRKVYNSEVVSRALVNGLDVTHDYRNNLRSIPLPATLSMEWAKAIGSTGRGVEARIFSDYPFPWNKEGGPKDSFEQNALEFLRKNPEKPYFEFDTKDNHWRLRYARADRLQESCVSCHNNHPQSPKKDWKAGDVRGVLEVTLPMTLANFEGVRILRERILLIIVIAALGFAMIYSFLRWVFRG